MFANGDDRIIYAFHLIAAVVFLTLWFRRGCYVPWFLHVIAALAALTGAVISWSIPMKPGAHPLKSYLFMLFLSAVFGLCTYVAFFIAILLGHVRRLQR